MTMASRQTMSLELRESQLSKLTNNFVEIRMLALEQVETRFIRCLLLDEKISVKPVFMLKQLIRWFGCKPLLAVDRVLAIMLELLRSEYADELVKKIPHERLSAELDKIKTIVRPLESKRAMELLDDLQRLLPDIYDIHVPPTPSPSSISQTDSTSETESSFKDQLDARFQPEDFEPAWTEPCKEDMLTMKTMIDLEDSDAEMNEKLISLTIKMGDYPSEYFLQAPNIFFKLLKIQQKADDNLRNVNCALIKYLLQLQSSIEVRRATSTLAIVGYSSNRDLPTTRPKQLRVESALCFLLSCCTKLFHRHLLQFSGQNWLIMELITEAIRTYCALRAPVSYLFIERLVGLAKKTQTFCYSAPGTDVAQLVDMIAVPRLHSLFCNGLLHDSIVKVNGKSMTGSQARDGLQPVTMDIVYMMCMPDRDLSINNHLSAVSPQTSLDKQLRILYVGYSMLIEQLQPTHKRSAEDLILIQSYICVVLDQLGSKSLVKELFNAIVKCNRLYGKNPKLRMQAEILLYNLMNLRDPELRGYFYNLMRHPCGLFFHAVAQKSVYQRGCSNIELIRQRIFGLPLNTKLLRQFVLQSWQDNAPEGVQDWCLQYLDLLINLSCTLKADDYRGMFEFLQPAMVPLMICRSVTCSSLHKKLWKMACPDEGDVLPKLRTNVCYLFHSDSQIRVEAATRIAYILQYQDSRDKKKKKVTQKRIISDFGVVQPPWSYESIFSATIDEPFQGERSLGALMRLLETKDLKPAIRKSTFTQLNVLLQNWNASGYFMKTNLSLLLVMQALQIALGHIKSAENVENLLPVLSVLIKIQFWPKKFRQDSGQATEMYLIMAELLFETTQYPELRESILICLFQMLCHEHMTATASKLVLDVDLSSLIVPITYELRVTEPFCGVTGGLNLEKTLLKIYFGQDAGRARQHWRIKVALCICDTPEKITLEAVHKLDIRESMKLTAPDLALIHATQMGTQLGRQLTAASNCSSHEELKEIVSRIQTHLVLLRTAVPEMAGISLWNLMKKYLRVAPSNTADREVYMSVSELCLTCMRFCVPHVWNGLNQALELDPHHSFLLLLHDRTIGLDMLQAICEIMVALLVTQTKVPANMNWHGKLFMQLSAVARTHFEVRQLLHVRCLLSVLHYLSERDLRLSETQLMYYIRHFVQLSSDLLSPTQTGSQWQRDCLHIACQLHTRCKPPVDPPTVAASDDKGQHIANKIIAYLVGLCGHSDAQVRSLAWVSMANWISKSGASVGKVLAPMEFPPGGLIECCLATMLHVEEIMLVKELAGRMFVMLMPQMDTEETIEMLRRHDFLEEAYYALTTLHDASQLQTNAQGEKSSYGLIGCYIAICSLLVTLKPTWCGLLCEHRFMNCLSDVIKTSPPSMPYLDGFLEMCAGISELYALCYSTNFEFLQRTICRDSVLLESFLTLINHIVSGKEFAFRFLTRFLKIFLVFCKDPNAYEFLFEQLNTRTNVFIEIFLYATNLKFKGTAMQQHTISALTMVCLKAQNAPDNLNFMKKMDQFGLAVCFNVKDDCGSNEENNMNVLNCQLKPFSSPPFTFDKMSGDGSNVACSVVILYQKLYRLFDHYFPAKTFNFLKPPGTGHVQIGEVLGAFLKVSPSASDAANRFNLLDRVLDLLDDFVSDVDIGNASTYVKRVGAHKVRDILNNLVVLINMLVQWHSSPHSGIKNAAVAARFVRLQIRLWPWLSHSAHLKCLCIQLAMFLTEHSFEMCKQSSVVLSGQSTSLLQLMVRVANFETTRKEAPNAVPYQSLTPALRVMINCCACGEARLSLSKMHVLNIFDTILPATVGASHAFKVSPQGLFAWLGFWEVYSRYDVGSRICHFHGLISAIKRMQPLSPSRILCLRIFRNMSFSLGNRLPLVGNADFISMLNDIVSQPVKDADGGGDGSLKSYEEHSLVVLILWKLYCFVAKYQAILRGSKLMKKLTCLQEKLNVIKKERPEFFEQLPHAPELDELLDKVIHCMEK